MTSPIPPRPASLPLMPGADPQNARAWKAARDFEAMALGELLKPMFETVDMSKSAFGGGSAEEQWKPMLVTELARKIAEAGGLGLARPVYEQMLRMQEDATAQGLVPKPAARRPDASRPSRKDTSP